MLNTSQLATFKAAINGDANLAAARAAGDQGAIAAYYNAAGSGSIWRPSINSAELNTAIVWSEFIALPVQTQNAYFALVQGGKIDATNANIRAGFSSIFAGTTIGNLTALAARVPTRFEALFTTANVCSCFGQTVTPADVAQALGS
jgi:hypothetical protein